MIRLSTAEVIQALLDVNLSNEDDEVKDNDNEIEKDNNKARILFEKRYIIDELSTTNVLEELGKMFDVSNYW